jgi:hypothetical protein
MTTLSPTGVTNRRRRLLESDIKEIAKEGMALNNNQFATVSTELLLTVLLLRLIDERDEGRAMTVTSLSNEHLVDSSAAAAAAAAKKKRAAAAAAKKIRHKRKKAASKHKKIKRMVWPGSGFISLIMTIFAFGSITTSFIHQSDGSGEAKNNSPAALPPSASRSRYLRHKTDHSSNYDIVASTMSPVVVPTQILAAPTPTTGIRRMTSDKLRASTCLDTPHWRDVYGYGCDDYEEEYCLSVADLYEGDMGPATKHCCKCGGGSTTVSQIHSFGLKLLR